MNMGLKLCLYMSLWLPPFGLDRVMYMRGAYRNSFPEKLDYSVVVLCGVYMWISMQYYMLL